MNHVNKEHTPTPPYDTDTALLKKEVGLSFQVSVSGSFTLFWRPNLDTNSQLFPIQYKKYQQNIPN